MALIPIPVFLGSFLGTVLQRSISHPIARLFNKDPRNIYVHACRVIVDSLNMLGALCLVDLISTAEHL
jgi:hypothetical protein